jgi:hypothetical protein
MMCARADLARLVRGDWDMAPRLTASGQWLYGRAFQTAKAPTALAIAWW